MAKGVFGDISGRLDRGTKPAHANQEATIIEPLAAPCNVHYCYNQHVLAYLWECDILAKP